MRFGEQSREFQAKFRLERLGQGNDGVGDDGLVQIAVKARFG